MLKRYGIVGMELSIYGNIKSSQIQILPKYLNMSEISCLIYNQP